MPLTLHIQEAFFCSKYT